MTRIRRSPSGRGLFVQETVNPALLRSEAVFLGVRSW